MSFQAKTDVDAELLQKPEPISHFEYHIMQCCKATEWDLRKFLKKVLIRSGFQIFEDQYKTERVSKEPRYASVHNMLAVRGKPSVCLVAHTDVCRDHSELNSRYGEFGERHHWMYERHEDGVVNTNKVRGPRPVEPVIKVVNEEGVIRRVIQDKDCKVQVGGDDRLGVAINTWIALNTGYDVGLFFPTDEEIGLKSARACEMQKLKEFDLLVQVDRGNHSDELVIKISNEILCTYETATRLLEIAYDIQNPRSPITGMSTDVYALKSRGMCKEAVNMTCGYHSSYGAGANEYIDIKEATDTMKYVAAIVKSYYLDQK